MVSLEKTMIKVRYIIDFAHRTLTIYICIYISVTLHSGIYILHNIIHEKCIAMIAYIIKTEDGFIMLRKWMCFYGTDKKFDKSIRIHVR